MTEQELKLECLHLANGDMVLAKAAFDWVTEGGRTLLTGTAEGFTATPPAVERQPEIPAPKRDRT